MKLELPPLKDPQSTAPKKKIIDSLWLFLVAVATLGPFALPLLWRNPKYKLSTKIIASVLVLAFTYYLLKFAADVNKKMFDQILLMQQQMGNSGSN